MEMVLCYKLGSYALQCYKVCYTEALVLVCGGNHTHDQPWILDGVVDVSAQWGRHLRHLVSIIGRHKKVFSSLRL
jgi:hypothetical protein